MLTVRPKLKLYRNYEHAKEEVEKLQQELYPNLGNMAEMDLDSIAEECPDQTDTNNDNTEETSDALGSDDEERQPHAEDEENADESEDVNHSRQYFICFHFF